MIQIQNIHKLSTREDAYNIHKILGITCLLNFLYRYTHLFLYGGMGLENELGKGTLIIHSALSCSSLLFHISGTRNQVKPIIYPEFRMHSILFAMRSIVVCFLYYYHFHYGYMIGTCYSVLFLSDLITNSYNKENKNGTTMRNMQFEDNIPEKKRKYFTKLHCIMQIGATLFMLGNIDSAFSPIMPIQISAFLMTLVKKSIISVNTLQFIYSFTLFVNYLLLPTLSLGTILYMMTIIKLHETVVFKYRINKFIGWTFHFTAYIIYREYNYENTVNEFIINNEYTFYAWYMVYGLILYRFYSFWKEFRILL